MDHSLNEDSSDLDPIDELVDEFLLRLSAGENPTTSEFCLRYPHLEKEIREIFPTVMLIEERKATSSLAPEPMIDRVGDYRIHKEIGRGGMGVVYQASQESLGRTVALKVLSKRWATNQDAMKRFRREAQAAARLHHTNIVPVYEVGESHGHCYYAMQLIEGKSLDKLISEFGSRKNTESTSRPGTLSSTIGAENVIDDGNGPEVSESSIRGHDNDYFKSVAELGVQAADALAFAHTRGIIHRDIKPSNLLLDTQGVVWITDFGLAKTDADAMTRDGDVLGTVSYMSPERFRQQCDARADIYALGLTLYELLALQPAFHSSDRLRLISLISDSEPPTLSSLVPEIPRDLETVVLKATSKEPQSRYSSAAEMADDLRRFVDDQPIKARRAPVIERMWRWSRRNKRLAAALAGIATLLVLMVIGATWSSVYQAELRQNAETAQGIAEQRSDSLQRNLYLSQMNLAGQAAFVSFGMDTVKDRIAEWRPEIAGRDLRNWEWYYLFAESHQAVFVSEALGNGFCWACDHSPDSQLLVHTKNAWGIQVRRASTGEVVRQKFLGSARFVDWSPDGRKIAVSHFEGKISVLDAETLEVVCEPQIEAEPSEIEWVQWSPDSTRIAAFGMNDVKQKRSAVRIHNGHSGALTQLLETESAVHHLAWHPDGDRIALVSGGSTSIWNVATGERLDDYEVGGDIAWSLDGTMLVGLHDSAVWDVLESRRIAEVTGASSLCWHPQGNQLAVGCRDGAVRLMNMANGRIERVLYGHTSDIWSVSWSSDGRWLASCGVRDETVRIWGVDSFDQSRLLTGEEFSAIDWNFDSTQIAACRGSYFCIWELSTAERLHELSIEVSPDAVQFDPRGQHVASVGRYFDVLIWNASTGGTQRLADSDWMFGLAWHHSGKLAAASTSGNIRIWNDTGNPIRTIEAAHDAAGGCVALDWNPSGTRIASLGMDGRLKAWVASTGELLWESELGSVGPKRVRWSNNGTRLATAHRGELILWDAATGDKLKQLDEINENYSCLDWSPDDTRLAAGSETGLSIWDIDLGRVALKLNSQQTHAVRWNHDGKRLAAAGTSGLQIWDASRGYALQDEAK